MNKEIEDFNLIPPINLREDNSIFDALEVIEDKHWMIVTVIDSAGKLLGVVSPGDLRKAILNGHAVSTHLSVVMNKEPISLTDEQLKRGEDHSEVLEDARKRFGQIAMMYSLIPIVNKEFELLGLMNVETLTNYSPENKHAVNNRTVLIVGGAGYIGSVLTRMLLIDGWRVRVLDKLLYTDKSLRSIDDDRFTLIEGDAVNIDNIVTAAEGVDAVVYLAELVGDPACSLAPQATLKTNYLAVTSMAHLCSHLNINRFIYTSSCSVYGASENPETLLTEESALCPVSLYARIKALVEESILSVCNLPNPLFSPTILRLGTVFGHSYRPRFDLVVNIFAKNAMQKGKIEIFGGDQWRPNVHVRDVAAAIKTTLNAPIDKVRAQTFNVGSNAANHTINDLGAIAKDIFPGIEVVNNDVSVDKRNYRVDFSKIEDAIGFKAKVSVAEGMQEIKEIYASSPIDHLDDAEYSNIKKLKKLNFV